MEIRSAAFSITEETVVHKRYLTLYNREIRFPPTKTKKVLATARLHGPGYKVCQKFIEIIGPCPNSPKGSDSKESGQAVQLLHGLLSHFMLTLGRRLAAMQGPCPDVRSF